MGKAGQLSLKVTGGVGKPERVGRSPCRAQAGTLPTVPVEFLARVRSTLWGWSVVIVPLNC